MKENMGKAIFSITFVALAGGCLGHVGGYAAEESEVVLSGGEQMNVFSSMHSHPVDLLPEQVNARSSL